MVDKSILDITEHEERFIQVSPYMLSGYLGLTDKLSKIANWLFLTLRNKIYKKAKLSEEKKDAEDRRIYTNICTTDEDILIEHNPKKDYSLCNMNSDIANMRRYLNDLHDQNIFYHWRFRDIYIFIMERNIRAWKYYNPKATIPPKTIKKILPCLHIFINRMATFYLNQHNKVVDRIKLENSLGEWLNEMICAMSPSVSDKIPKWEYNTSLFSYIQTIEPLFKDIQDEEGLDEDEEFIYNLPDYIQEKVFKKRGITEEDIMSEKSSLDMEKIIPEESKIGVKKKRKTKNSVRRSGKTKGKTRNGVDLTTPPVIQTFSWKTDMNPFDDAPTFTKFFQKNIRNFNPKAICPKISMETTDAGRILDKMIDSGRKNDNEFLFAWIKWYCEYNLKGDKIFNVKHTCIKKFGETFLDYNSTYRSTKDKLNLIPE